MVSFPFVRCTTGWFVELYFRPETPGVENIPKTGPCIIASNHASNLDPYMLGYTIKERELYFIAKEELFHNPIFGWIIRMNNAFPVKRGQRDLEAIRKFHDFIQTGKPLAIFMEGTRTHDGNLQPPKKGAGRLIYDAKAPVIPTYIEGTYQSMPRGGIFPKRARIKVHYGPPVPLDDLFAAPSEKPTYIRIAERVMEHIAKLKPKTA